jgi:hypothetical protein
METGLIPKKAGYIILFQLIGIILIGAHYLKGFDVFVKLLILIFVVLVWYKLDKILFGIGAKIKNLKIRPFNKILRALDLKP